MCNNRKPFVQATVGFIADLSRIASGSLRGYGGARNGFRD
jgi:hypothetical protein